VRDGVRQRLDYLPDRFSLLDRLALHYVLQHHEGQLGNLHATEGMEADGERERKL
jgi:hypothetical protein